MTLVYKASNHHPAAARSVRPSSEIIARLKGVVLLGGSVRATALSGAIQRSLLDLPLDNRQSLLTRWVEQTGVLAAAYGRRMSLQVMLDAASPAPPSPELNGSAVDLSIMRDPSEYRGTGGVLHDIARPMADDDYLVVATGAQLLIEPLKNLVETLADDGGDVGIMAHRDGTPSGLMLMRCGVLREISDLGFVDLKEQALPGIAKKHRVIVEQVDTVSFPVRTFGDYLAALRQYHRRMKGKQVTQDPFAEDWKAEFSVVESGTSVDPGARLFDSVVLRGATVGPGVVLVRSVVCGGTIVRPGQRGADQIFSSGGRVHLGGRR